MSTSVTAYTDDLELNRLCNQLQRWYEANFGIEGIGYVKHVMEAHTAGVPFLRAAIDMLLIPPSAEKLQGLYDLILTGDRLAQWWDLEFHHANTQRYCDASLAAKLPVEVLSTYIQHCMSLVDEGLLQLPNVRQELHRLINMHQKWPQPHPATHPF